jgi:hypothetical protein
MSFDFATFLTTIPAILDARLPVLVRGRHGVAGCPLSSGVLPR